MIATCFVVAALFSACLPLTAIVRSWDARGLDGENVWNKPLKFELSLAVFFATAGLAASCLSPASRDGALMRGSVAAAVASAVAEMVYIIVQAARGERSHFNLSTPVYAALYAAMAVGAVLITALYGVIALLASVDASPTMTWALRVALVLGLGTSCVATLWTGFAMGARRVRHTGVHDPARGVLPVTGWSRSAGDLRAPHFLASHMAQIVLGSAWIEPLVLADYAAAVVVGAIAATCMVAVVLTYRASNNGTPCLRPSSSERSPADTAAKI